MESCRASTRGCRARWVSTSARGSSMYSDTCAIGKVTAERANGRSRCRCSTVVTGVLQAACFCSILDLLPHPVHDRFKFHHTYDTYIGIPIPGEFLSRCHPTAGYFVIRFPHPLDRGTHGHVRRRRRRRQVAIHKISPFLV